MGDAETMEFLPHTTIPIINDPDNTTMSRFVDSRDIHAFMGAKKRCTSWIRQQLKRLECTEGRDYFTIKHRSFQNKKYSNRSVYFVTVKLASAILAGKDSLADLTSRFHDSYTPLPETGCWIWDYSKELGEYGRIHYKCIRKRAHRVSWVIHFGPIPKGLNVLHRCDIPSCVNPHHLFLGTQKDNIRDMLAKKRSGVVGSRHHLAKLSETSVAEARALKAAGYSIKFLCAKYGVHYRTMCSVLRKTTWRHV